MAIDQNDPAFGRPELLARAADRAVKAGKLAASATSDVVQILANKCIVDSKLNCVLLNGKSLDEGLADEIAKRLHWQTVPADLKVVARADLEARALKGELTAHGLLMRELGATEYDKWRIQNGSTPGKPAITAEQKEKADNPWSAAGWNVTRQAQLVRASGLEKAAQIAKAAGSYIGATRPAA